MRRLFVVQALEWRGAFRNLTAQCFKLPRKPFDLLLLTEYRLVQLIEQIIRVGCLDFEVGEALLGGEVGHMGSDEVGKRQPGMSILTMSRLLAVR